MTGFAMPRQVVDRVMEKRGRLHVFDSFDPRRTAFAVIDMQNFFVRGVAPCLEIVPNVNRLAGALRDAGGTVAWVSLTVAEEPGGPSLWPLYHEHFFTEEKRAAHKDGLTRGSEGHALHAGLDARNGDVFAEKTRFSAFIQGASDLHDRLQERGIENLLVGGTLTNMCCESSARDAMMIGYRTVMVEDCNASRLPEEHLAGLTSVYQSFCDVRSTDETVGDLLGLAAAAA